MFAPRDLSEVEMLTCVRDSGAFRRQTAAETQTEVVSQSFAEVGLDSLTFWLMCYCNGKLHILEALCLTLSFPVSLPRALSQVAGLGIKMEGRVL